MWQPSILILTVLLTQAYTAPQFITFKDGKLGVNFGGYHAAVGLGGLLGGNGGAEGGLFAEAGTPHGQAARAGLGGSVGPDGKSNGGLYAGATAGGNVKAAAGLGGEVAAERSSGAGFASASAGGHYASSGLGGATVVKETEFAAVPVKELKHAPKKAYSEVKYETFNEIVPVNANFGANFDVKAETQPAVLVKEVSNRRPRRHHRNKYYKPTFQQITSSWFNVPQIRYTPPAWFIPPRYNYFDQVYVEPEPQVIEKTIIHTHKPHRHHFRKTAYIGGYVEHPTVVKPVQPIERRSDVGVQAEGHAYAGADAGLNANNHGHSGEVAYTKRVTVQKTPPSFQDIFNIPIATLKAVSSLLTNAAGNTNISVQKTASVHADSDFVSSKHVPDSKSVVSSSAAHVSVQTPSGTQLIDDIFSIPINTLSAVSSFLQNNQARKQFQISSEVGNEPTKVRLGPHARRRANKNVVVVQEPAKPEQAPEASN